MLNDISRTQLIGAWIAAVIVMMACSVVVGAALTFSAGILWVVVGVVPPAVMMLLWHGAPPATVAQLLRVVDVESKAGRS